LDGNDFLAQASVVDDDVDEDDGTIHLRLGIRSVSLSRHLL
jgi:hypothetical protein